jgi:Spy/CpxP family protein refolding chaperone
MDSHPFGRGILALAIGLIAALPVSAMPPGPPPDAPMTMPPGPMAGEREPVPPFLHGLNLSPEQRDKVFELLHAQAPTMRAKAKDIQTARETLRSQSLGNEFDASKAATSANALARAVADMALLQARADQQIYHLLTPEQQRQVQEHGQRRDEEGCRRDERR